MSQRVDAAVILAAGQGTRMKSQRAKVLHEIAGMPLVGHVLGAVAEAGVATRVVVIGHDRDRVRAYLDTLPAPVLTAVQEHQRGTGDAVRVALAEVPGQSRTVMVLTGDTPLLRGSTLAELVGAHAASGAVATVLTTHMHDPSGYGRIVRNAVGDVTEIVEHRDATEEQLAITEVNSGIFVFDRAALEQALAEVGTRNAQGEVYLTDVVGLLVGSGRRVSAFVVADSDEIHGINDRVQLAAAAVVMRNRINDRWMRAGVTIRDPATTWIDAGADVGQDAIIERNSHLSGSTSVAGDAVIGPDTTLVDCRVGTGARVLRSHCERAEIGDGATVGPFTYLRPGADLGPSAKAGAFVEIKNAAVGEGAKVPHLSYVGDAEIGAGTNIGAATIFVNYDGVAKHRTVVGEQVRIGSDSMLVAPVRIGDGAYTAAGSVITEDVPAGALALGRARQRNVERWVLQRREGSPSADAARSALNDL